ncbi:InlB B-repeat-containing protein [Bifidobacterium adolescentis]|nr:InlB B-repeat-containing protein [Bifidobacterium adolescentis]KAB5751870.1 InlB B-repeat-containing protein [Bifidobacterium adolescentis]KAB5755694.1 InlB B-repeat-containing protein [Bifidobacterium adolescentis]KAB5759578.1 InlB B-repeat-containing protein [Bifidobacterium adolescentis]KAB5760002.1 InlB B-repeat-containing protein [Bifidobacterium adolescentis]
MGFLTRLLAGLTAAAALGAGLTGTANAVDVTGATGNTKSVVKLADDGTSNLPDHLVNGDFEYPVKSDMPVNDGNFWYISQNDGSYFANGTVLGKRYKLPEGFDKAKFAWHSTQTGDTYYPDLERADDVQVDYTADGTNHYSEISAAQSGATIYQDVATVPGVMYKWSLKHASLDSSHLDKMSVIIGEPGKETAQEATRTTANGHGDKLGKVGTVISTKVSNPEMPAGNKFQEGAHTGQWETYTGTYIATGTVTRFAFRSVEGYSAWDGNLLDDISFSKAYKLTYDKNASDATGSVPSDTTANTVKQAKADATGTVKTVTDTKTKTSGTVKTVADTNASLPDHLVNGDFNVNYHDQWKDSFGGWTSIDPNAGKTLHATSLPNGSSWKWTAINGWDKSKFGWTSTQKAGSNVQQKANAVELQYDDSTADNVYAELCAYEADTAIYQDIRTVPGTLYKVRLKHASLNSTYLDKMQVMIGTPGHEQPVEMTRTTVNGHGDKLNEKSTTIATKVTNSNNRHHADQWETYEGTYLIPDGQTTTRFTFKSIDAKQLDYGNVLDDIVFDKAYRLSYDKNASDASGQVPSNERGRENTTQPAKDKTSGTVRLASDDDAVEYAASNLPKQIVNSDFDHDWRNIVGQSKMTGKYNFANIDPAHGDVEVSGPLNGKGEASKQWVHLNGFDASQFGWKSNQTDTRVDGRGGIVEIQRSRANDNMYAEITASQANTYLYQDIDTAHSTPTVYTVKLRYAHRNGTINSNEKIQILVGAPGHEQPVEMTRIASDRGNRLGEKSTTVNAPNTDGWLGSWDTFQGSVVVPAGQNVSRFTFKSLGSIDGISGNLIDDVQFKLAYKLSYDKNANDASGSVPSDETANTVKQAKARTTGTVRAVADRTASGLTVHDLKKGDIAPAQYGDFKFSTTDGFTAEQVTDVNDFTVKQNWDPTKEDQAYADKNLATMYQPNKNGASLVLHHVGQWRDSSGTQRWLNAKITVNGQNLGSLVYYESQHKFLASYGKWDRHTSSRPYMDVTVDFLLDDGSTPQGLRGVTGFTDLDGGTSGYNEGVELVSGFDGAYVRSDAHLARFGTNGWAGATDENENNADAHGMKHYVGATFTGSSFRVRWSVASGQARGSGFQPVDSTIAYRLTYNKNAQDATGSIPSDTAANTTQPAKSETDGKVSDLVQRTTTHEDGSVTVKTIDTSTDVVSGCQVYYPASQRITLATMAKDDDCWDSSMLSRPGHTQLGWNQDRNATQAQAQVTMVEGGMTVYAVWVGNPVLTYDTNKPSTWSGQMPSTPASVSVAYNTAAADGSGWKSGDTSKIRGYRFLGWYTGPQDNAGLYDWTRPLTGSVTVYAHWQRLQANVVYNANGGTGSHPNTTGWQYSDVTIPGDTSKSFTRDGYVFKGWSLKAGKADVVYKDGSQIPLQDKDITLYAQWQGIHENFTETGGISLPLLIAGGIGLLVMGVGSTVMLTRRMNGHGMPDGE